jgi:aspartate-semialdehyde dehydrogenase
MDDRIDVGVLGATGVVGQQFVQRLTSHPWFRLTWIAASGRSEGRRYAEAAAWKLPTPMPAAVSDLVVRAPSPEAEAPRLLFSALDSSVAGGLEEAFAAAGHVVVSNARNHRMEPDVPLLVPEINPGHLGLLDLQRRRRHGRGAIVTNPNCSTAILVMTLAPLCQFGLKAVMVTTLQAVSGAGYPGVPAMDIMGNVIPHIDGEDEKIETETRKILGSLTGGSIEPHAAVVGATATRVPVPNGHTMSVSVSLASQPTLDEVRRALAEFQGRPQREGLPSAPPSPIVVCDSHQRPQPRLDVGLGDGMTVSVGRLRPCPVLGFRYVALGDNTIRGAAGAAILNAELLHVEGLLA